MDIEARDESSMYEDMYEDMPVISSYTYTRAQAIADGVLIDVTEAAREAGFRFPVALTAEVWERCVAWEPEDSDRQTYQDQSGRLWDVLWMAYFSILTHRGNVDASRMPYRLLVVPRDGKSCKANEIELHVHIGPGDEGEPVLTIMMPWED
jgi:hypothetical protein